MVVRFGWLLLLATLLLMARPAVARQANNNEEPPEPEDVSLTTSDGVELKVTFFPGTEGKQSVPVILLHDYKEQRGRFLDLANRLQQAGFAVLLPDLRGHGESTHVEGMKIDLTADHLNKQQFIRMVKDDLETLKRFLVAKNNEEQLNVDKLCVVGAGMGAVVAINWAALDWSWPVLTSGKQGQDVKALVLISPPQSFRGLTTSQALSTEALKKRIAIFLAIGRNGKRAKSQAKRIYNQLHRTRSTEEKERLQTVGYSTSLQGTKLLKKEFSLEKDVVNFLTTMVADQSIPWASRRPAVQ